MKQHNIRVAVYVSNPKGAYSGGRYHGLMIAEALADSCEVFYVTNQIPIFWDDFSAFEHHGKIKVIGGWKNSLSELPDALDFIVVVPGTSEEEFYDAALGAAIKKNARIVLVNFESENWFNQYAPVKKSPTKWDSWNRIASAASVILSSAEESTTYAKQYYLNVPKQCSFEHCYPAINTKAADSISNVEREKRLVLLTRFTGDVHKGGGHIASLIGPYMSGYTLSILIGNGEVPEQIRNEIEGAALWHGVNVEWLHKLTDVEKFELYKKSEYLLFPSYFEGYGYPPIEARYSGCKVIAFDLPVLRETCGDDAIFAEHGSIENFKEKLQDALSAPVPLSGYKLEETAPLSAMTQRLMEIFQRATRHKPDFDLLLMQYGRPKCLIEPQPFFGRFEKKIISIFKYVRQHLKRKRGRITYFPMFGDENELTSHYHRATWYFPYKKGLIEKVRLYVTDSKLKPGVKAPLGMHTHSGEMKHIKVRSSRWALLKNIVLSDVIMLWDGQCTSKWLKVFHTLGIPVVNVDTRDVGAKEYGDYPGTIWRHLMTREEKVEVIKKSFRNFNALAQQIRKAGYKRAAVFGTGPSLEAAHEYNFDDTLTIICNSIVQNHELMRHLKPMVVTAGDAVSHFGVSEYAARFRKDLVEALRQYNLYYFGTATFGYLMSLHYPELADKFIFIEQDHNGPNFDLLENFSAPKLDSTMNIHMLPLAATFADDIYILGCDGKAPSVNNEDFWAHAKGAQYHDLVDTGHQCHPVFDIHRQKATYNRHLDSVRSTLELGEQEHGKRYTSLKRSYIPAFAERNLDQEWYKTHMSDINPIPLSFIAEELGPLEVKTSVLTNQNVTENLLSISEAVCKGDLLFIKGWFLSPYRKTRLLIEYDNGYETYLMKKTKRPDVAKKHPEYRQEDVGIEFMDTCKASVKSVTISIVHNAEKLKSLKVNIQHQESMA